MIDDRRVATSSRFEVDCEDFAVAGDGQGKQDTPKREKVRFHGLFHDFGVPAF
jgi:hypothetical protein